MCTYGRLEERYKGDERGASRVHHFVYVRLEKREEDLDPWTSKCAQGGTTIGDDKYSTGFYATM